MFEVLSAKLNKIVRNLASRGRLTESEIDEALREVRISLLEADVNFRVTRDLISRIRSRILQEVSMEKLSPGQQVIKIVNEELIDILGGGIKKLETPLHQPGIILLVGLNGSGKTTTSAKLAKYLKQNDQSSVLVAADLNRPAAIDQLVALGNQIDVTVYQEDSTSTPLKVASNGITNAIKNNASWTIVDTAGRFEIDDNLMLELEEMKDKLSPTEILLVVDAMTGQDAVNVAQEFHKRLTLTGLILTKLDGDARGGAALSITAVTGIPIKFIGTGEHLDALDQLHPDRLASRILGMGDMLTLIEKTQNTFDQQQAIDMEKKIRQATFDLDDFLAQLQQLKKMGPLNQIIQLIPGFSSIKSVSGSGDMEDNHLKKIEAVIYSMTPQERQKPGIIDGSRRRRIALGSATTSQDVNQLLNQFKQVQKLMKQMASGKSRDKMMNMLNKPFDLK
jgi:signal recognition particle subunit SRP54